MLDKILGRKYKKQFIYFYRLRDAYSRNRERLYKIGISDRLEKRKKAIERDFKTRLRPIIVVELFAAHEIEQLFKKRYYSFRDRKFRKGAGKDEIFALSFLQVITIWFSIAWRWLVQKIIALIILIGFVLMFYFLYEYKDIIRDSIYYLIDKMF